eukprot:GFYU01009063.1.p1 GENE.GFYU01009063.1~~GFYU01009063.1.p1  ORF type:complete len:298 (-),score=82.20 GFYU01009063.1:201-1094(-)
MSTSQKSLPVNDLIAGTMGGIAQVIAGHPLDTVKTRLQTQVIVPGQPPQYAGMIDCFKKTSAQEGWRGLYKGAAAPLAGAMFHNANLFFSYGQSKNIVMQMSKTDKMESRHFFAAGMMTGGFVSLIEAPIDLFKCKLQAQTAAVEGGKPQYTGVYDCAKQTASRYGIRGVYQGLGATWLRNIPAFGCYFCAGDTVKQVMTPPGEKPSTQVMFLSGAAAGFAFWGLNYPLELIKTRMQTDHSEMSQRKYKSIIDCATKTLRNDGVQAFFRGYTPCLIRAIAVNGAIFLAVESTKKYMF